MMSNLEDSMSRTYDKLQTLVEKMNTTCDQIKDELIRERGMRIQLEAEVTDLKTQVKHFTVTNSALTTQVNNLNLTVNNLNFAAQQPSLKTDTKIPVTPTLPSVSVTPAPLRTDPQTPLQTIKASIDLDISAIMPADVVDRDMTFLAMTKCNQETIEYYKNVSKKHQGAFTTAQVCALHLITTGKTPTLFRRSTPLVKKYVDLVPPGVASVMQHVLLQICNGEPEIPRPKLLTNLRLSLYIPDNAVTPQHSVESMSKFEKKARGLL